MKKLLIPAMLFLLVASPAFAQKKAKTKTDAKAKAAPAPPLGAPGIRPLALGSNIPNAGFMMQATNGEMHNLDQAKTDKGLLVMFSCNTCPFVIKSQKRTSEIIALAKEKGIGMVIINSNEAKRQDDDSPEAMRIYAEKEHYSVPYLKDDGSQIADFFGATRTPEVFLFDASGKLVYKGAMEDNPTEPEKSKQFYLSAAIQAMIASKPIAMPETKSIGCGIKRLGGS